MPLRYCRRSQNSSERWQTGPPPLHPTAQGDGERSVRGPPLRGLRPRANITRKRDGYCRASDDGSLMDPNPPRADGEQDGLLGMPREKAQGPIDINISALTHG